MKKEKKIRTYQRRTKSGKLVTVKAHTAKYDAAEKAKELAKKKGAGDELEERKKKKSLVKDTEDVAWDILDAYTEKDVREVATALGISPKQAVSWLDGPNYPNFSEKDYYKGESAAKKFLGSSVYKRLDPSGADIPMAVIAKLREAKVPKSSKGEASSLKSKPTKKANSYEQHGFTKEEFAEWYEGTGSKADKKVEKALRKAMGSKAYNDLNDSAADNYKKGGADAFFKKGIKKMQATTKSKDTSPFMRKEKKSDRGSYYSTDTLDKAYANVVSAAKSGNISKYKAAISEYGQVYSHHGDHFEDEDSEAYRRRQASAILKLATGLGVDYWGHKIRTKTTATSKSEAAPRKSKTKKSFTTAKRMKPSEVADMTTKRDWIYEG